LEHCFVEEGGGAVRPNVEEDDEEREKEGERVGLQHTAFETIEAVVVGEKGLYKASMIASGGCGRSRVSFSAAMMEESSTVEVAGLLMSGGLQHVDMRTNLHHVAAGCNTVQSQRNVVGGRSTSVFRGRIRVEQSAQQTDSKQVSLGEGRGDVGWFSDDI